MSGQIAKPSIRFSGVTTEQSNSISAFASFLTECLEAHDAIRTFRDGSGGTSVAWPAWLKAVPPAGVGPDLSRCDWEAISEKGRRLLNALPFDLIDPFEILQGDPRYEASQFVERLAMRHGKAYRLVRYAWWWDSYDLELRTRLDHWVSELRTFLAAAPFDPVVAAEALPPKAQRLS